MHLKRNQTSVIIAVPGNSFISNMALPPHVNTLM